MGYDIHCAAYIIAHTLPVAANGGPVPFPSGSGIGRFDTPRYIERRSEAFEKIPQ
jgi:hypothetical protein